MNILVVFYSMDGNTKLIAENIAKAADADIMELKLKKDTPTGGFMKYFRAGLAVMTKQRPELLPLDRDPREYDLVFIGSPVWGGTYTPALRTFFTTRDLSDKNIALFCCRGGTSDKIFVKMKRALVSGRVLGETGFREPKKNNTEDNIKKAVEWARKMVEAGQGA